MGGRPPVMVFQFCTVMDSRSVQMLHWERNEETGENDEMINQVKVIKLVSLRSMSDCLGTANCGWP